jgi:hypothetical protein
MQGKYKFGKSDRFLRHYTMQRRLALKKLQRYS